MKFVFIFFLQLAIIGVSYSQNHHVYGLFPTLNLKKKLNPKVEIETYSFLSIHPMEQVIEGNLYPSRTSVFYTEFDVTYLLNNKWSFTGSYTYERVNPFEESYRNENRFWVQTTFKQKFERFNLKNRLRYDLRFIKNRATSSTEFNPRIRYLIGFDFPFNKDKNSLYLASYNEFFFNTYSNSIAVFGENWFSSSIGFSLSKQVKMEGGYLNISWIKDEQKNWLIQHYLQVTLIINLIKV